MMSSEHGCCFGELKLRNFGIYHEDPYLFGTSQWAPGPSVLYIIYRGLVAIYFLTVLILNILLFYDRERWIILLSHWSFIVLTLSVIFMFVSSVHLHYQHRRLRRTADPTVPMSWLYQVTWVFYNIAFNAAIIITILYWAFVYDGWEMEFININTHVVNAGFVFLDHFIVAIPVRMFHVYQPILYALGYALFTVIYFVAGGTGQKNKPYIYSAIDYGKDMRMALIFDVVLVFAVTSAVHVIFYGFYKLRVHIYNSCKRRVPTDHKDEFEMEKKPVAGNGIQDIKF